MFDAPTIEETEHAIILAAGRGSRLDPEEDYKLLVEVGGESLLSRHLRGFERLGVRVVTVVTGYRSGGLQREIEARETPDSLDVRTAVNPAFDAGNGLSVIAGVDQARRDYDAAVPFWLTMSDHVFESTFYGRLEERLEVGGGAPEGCLLVDRRLDHVRDVDDATKVKFDDGEFAAIGKHLDGFDAIDCGFFWCGESFVEALNAERERRGDCWTSDAVRALASDGTFTFVEVGEAAWEDIDTPADRERAENVVT